MQKIFLWGYTLAVSSLLAACDSGNTSTYQSLQVVPSVNPAVYQVNIGESGSMVFTNTIVSNAGPSMAQYNIAASVPSSSFTIFTESGNNGCGGVLANQSCNITIIFKPTTQDDYKATNTIKFSVGSLESSLNVETIPG